MSEPVTQRWATVPDKPMPLRKQRALGRGQMAPVLNFVDRQRAFDPRVDPWIMARADAYQAQIPELTHHQAQAEASVDLIAWQRRQPDVRKNAEFIADHESPIQ